MSSATNPHQIVVLGGNFGGVGLVHTLLRHTLPALRRASKDQTYHVTLVTPNTQFYFKVSSPRAAVNPALLPEAKLWHSLAEAFSQYPAEQFTLVQAVATAVDAANRTVTISSKGQQQQTLPYDSLVISTGTTTTSPLWGLHDDESLTSAAYKTLQAGLATAKTVLVAGGGAVGVEVTGEIAAAFPSVQITLVSGGTRLLQRVVEKTGTKAENYLKKLNIKVIHNVTVTSAVPVDAKSGSAATTVTLSDGQSHAVDVYVDATGGRPNSGYLPATWLDKRGSVVTRDAYFRVKGTADADAAGVYVVGDLVAGSNNTLMELGPMVQVACSAIAADITAKLNNSGAGLKVPAVKEYKPMKDTIIVPIGTGGGVGLIMGWQAPSLMVRFTKGRTFLVEMVEQVVSGTYWKA
ncbi:hypothetical protein B0T17DRAFT_528334 [Bombardia bombarda]|uniref:FAD/NAD(P)-binding domain-containing protein n=1 Tax=Bombardia bombarda TaxID=252184 RepID=A0AA39XAL3_9PEZI|nr:hypothetical protein B0T17DRAFT_528334 [Bombardia bombarda]